MPKWGWQFECIPWNHISLSSDIERGSSIQYSISIVHRGSVCPALQFMGNAGACQVSIIPIYYQSMPLKAQVQPLRKHNLSQQQQLKINEPEHVHLFHNEPHPYVPEDCIAGCADISGRTHDDKCGELRKTHSMGT